MPELCVEWMGTVPYAEALALQVECVEARRQGLAPDRLLLLEHPPVVTLGRSARAENLLESEDALRGRGVAVHRVARGGDVTWHAPGQLVGYAILDLAERGQADVHDHLRRLEKGLGDALAELGVPSHVRSGMTGVFAGSGKRGENQPARKIASIGVGLRGWVTSHGFALNVDLELDGFRAIVPCGLHGVEMTSVARELGASAPRDGLFESARDAVTRALPQALA